MKILLSWLLDYLDCSWTDIDIDRLVHLFNTRTAEIESYQRVTFDPSRFFIGKVVSSADKVEIFCSELDLSVTLSARSDVAVGKFYLIVKDQGGWGWAKLTDLGSDKEGLMPAIAIEPHDSKGAWRNQIPTVDYVLDVDNKSINHRPDLWGHYGIAREVAAFLDIPLKPLDTVIKKLEILHAPVTSKQHKDAALSIDLQAPQACSRFAGLLCDVQYQDCSLWMAIRLTRVGAKPLNAVVDITNYVMFDIGHPMHVFDAQAFPDRQIVVRMAQQGEKLETLDGQNVSLNSADLVIANNDSVVSLAGVIGGKNSGFRASTKQIILEAAGFDPGVIRKTAQRCKVRTEACMRFEKHLDPMQNIMAIERFVFLAQELKVLSKVNHAIVSVGQLIEPIVLDLHHVFIESQLGAIVQSAFVEKTLKKLGFKVQHDQHEKSYKVTIPTYRMTKDIKIAQDLVEEIIRSYGFENLDVALPMRATIPFSLRAVSNLDHIKHHLAYGLQMHEVRDYLLYDASFVAQLDIDLTHAIRVRNPLSENWTTLVTSLVPHLLKSVQTNVVGNQHLRFFEFNRVWSKTVDRLVEQKSLAGIVFDKKEVDFYQAKAQLQSLFDLLKLQVVWQKPQQHATHIPAWYDPYQVAHLYVGDKLLGIAGMMSSAWMHKVVSGSAFIFELDGAMLETYVPAQTRFAQWSKFQEVCYDISLFLPLQIPVDTIKKAIFDADRFIISVELVDFFEKEEWTDQRAVTLSYVIRDPDKTMNKQEIDIIVDRVQKAVVGYGAKIR